MNCIERFAGRFLGFFSISTGHPTSHSFSFRGFWIRALWFAGFLVASPVQAAPTPVTLNTPSQANGYYGLEVQLSWSQNGDADFASYKIYRATHAVVTQQDDLLATHSSSYYTQLTDYNAAPSPTPGTTYYYRVFVTDQAGQSVGSNETSIPLVDSVPNAVILLSPEPGYYGSEVRLRWTRSYESDITRYKVYRATHASVTQADTLVATVEAQNAYGDPIESYDYNAPATAPPGTTYYYKVFVYDQSDQSNGSNEESILRVNGVPVAVTLAVPTQSDGYYGVAVQLSWTRSTENDIASYQVYRATHAGVTQADTLVTTVDAANAYNDPVQAYDNSTGATPGLGTTYFYRVFVVDLIGQSTGSNEQSITLVDLAPSAVTLLSVQPGYYNEVQILWTRSTENDIASYQVYRATHANVTEQDTLVSSINANNVYGDPIQASDSGAPATAPPGTTYYYRVFVTDQAGQSTGSNELHILRVDELPGAVILDPPTQINGYYGLEVHLSWSQSSDTDFAAYKVYRATHENVTQNDTLVTTIQSAGQTQTSDSGATPSPIPGTTYYYRVFVVDQAGQSTGSNEENIRLVDTVPLAVTLWEPLSDYYPGTVHLRWTRSTESDIATYKVYRATHANVTELDTLVTTVQAQNAYGDPIEAYDYNAPASLPPGTRYYYRVFVYDQAGQSAGSNEESILLIAPPLAPGVPSFADITMTTLTATMPALPAGATTLTLQKRLASEYDSAFVNVATGLAGDAVVNVTGLEGSTDYVFRALAVGDGGSTPGPNAGVRMAELPPLPPDAPTFSDFTEQSVRVHAPVLPLRAQWLRLQGKLAGEPDSAYVDIATQVQGQEVTLVSNLMNGESYSFRYVAVGQGGATPGTSASITMPTAFYYWNAHTAINCAGIRWPAAGSNAIAPGATGVLSSFLATDWDKRDTRVIVNGQQNILSTKVLSDPCTYTWNATGGTFAGGNIGQSVRWTAPTTPGTYTVTLVVDDEGGANKPLDEVGARQDASFGYNDDPLRFSVTIVVQAPAP